MKRAAAQVGGAAIVVAIAGYVAQFLAARLLGPAEYTGFAVFWAVLFVVAGTLSGVSQEVIRVARVEKLESDAGRIPEFHGRPRIAAIAVGTSTTLAVIVLLSGLLWGPTVLGADWTLLVTLVAVGTVLLGGTLAALGTLAGWAEWRTYSGLLTLEGIARIVVFAFAAAFAPTVEGFALAAAAAFLPGVAVALCWARLRRATYGVRSDARPGPSTTRMLRAMGASGLSGILVIGWPALLSSAAIVNPRGSTMASLGVLILLLTLTRAPLMVPLTSFQNVLVARFTGFDLATRRRWVAGGSAVILGVSAVFAVFAAVVGPPLLPLIFGAGFRADGALIGALTAAAAGLGIITLSGVAAITSAHHSVYMIGWAVAIVIALVVLFFAPVPFEWATVLSLVAGPVVGTIVQLWALRAPGTQLR